VNLNFEEVKRQIKVNGWEGGGGGIGKREGYGRVGV